MNQYTVKLRNGQLMVVIGEIFLFDSKCTMPLKKDAANYFNAEDVVYILPILKPEIENG